MIPDDIKCTVIVTGAAEIAELKRQLAFKDQELLHAVDEIKELRIELRFAQDGLAWAKRNYERLFDENRGLVTDLAAMKDAWQYRISKHNEEMSRGREIDAVNTSALEVLRDIVMECDKLKCDSFVAEFDYKPLMAAWLGAKAFLEGN